MTWHAGVLLQGTWDAKPRVGIPLYLTETGLISNGKGTSAGQVGERLAASSIRSPTCSPSSP